MRGEEIRAVREERGLSQTEFAAWLNDRLGRRYDKQKMSRWETGSERIPAIVADLLSGRESVARPVGPALVLTVANQKGGVGKTVSAVNIASVLAAKGYATLLIDADSQANATMHLGVNPYESDGEGRSRSTLYTALRSETCDLAAIAVAAGDHGLRIVPSSIKLAEIEPELMAQSGGEHALAERLQSCRRLFDFIVIDTPPNIGQMTKNALTAADLVLIPCQTAIFSIVGMDFLLRNISLTKRRSNPRLDVLGILPTRFNRRLKNDVASLEDIRRSFAGRIRVFDPVPAAAVYDQTTAAGRAAVDVDPEAPGIAVYEAVVEILVTERRARVEVADVP